MIYIYVPNIALFTIWLYYIKFNIFLSILLTPITYLVINGLLIYNKQYNNVYNIFDKTIILKITENQLKLFCINIFKLINKISIVNKFFNLLKIKILIYLFNIIINLIPSKKSNELTNDLQNDYLKILNKNRNKKLSSNLISI